MPAVLAALAFAIAALVFVCEMRSFRTAVLGWASNDLESRTAIAADALREPLRQGDFRAVHAFSRQCEVDGIRLSVFGKPNGLVYDSLGGFTDSRRDGCYIYHRNVDVGDFEIRLGLPLDQVLAPFNRARGSFALAVLVGVTGVLLFFVVTYRQRVRIRELRRLERFRREFIADVSHEIKTPLTGILGAVDLMSDSPLVHLIRKESQRLNRLVQSILDLARLERPGEGVSMSETDLVELVKDVASRHPCKCAAEGRCIVRCDAQLLEQAVENLVVNAVRHSGSSDIAVMLSVRGKQAEVAVEDHGVGVPPEEQERIFERFHRVDPARAAETGGAGLGLAIVRRIARLHGGDAKYDSVLPHGSRFTIVLPLAPKVFSNTPLRGECDL